MSFVVHTPRSHGTHGLAEKAVCGLLHIQWGTARHASFVRCVLLAIWCVHLIVTPYHIYSDWPAEGLRGFGAMAVVAETPYRGILFDAAVLTGLRVAGIVLCLYLAMSRRGRLLTWVVVVIVYVLDGASKTIGGYANHAQIVPLLGLVACAVCSKVPYQPAADLLVMREDTVNTQSASAASGFVWLVALLVVVPYAFVALNRVVIGGVGVFSGDAMVNYTMAACGAQPQIVCREIGNWLHDDRVATLWRLGFALEPIS